MNSKSVLLLCSKASVIFIHTHNGRYITYLMQRYAHHVYDFVRKHPSPTALISSLTLTNLSLLFSLSHPQADNNKRHTIILMQLEKSKASRSYEDFETITKAIQHICTIFESKLRQLNPNLPNIVYEVQDLWRFIDNVPDLSALVYDPGKDAYLPCGKEWLKKKALQHLKSIGRR